MPYVNIRIIEGATPEQKAELIRGVTEVLSQTLNKDPAMTFVVIDDVALDSWGVGGVSVAERRRHQTAGAGTLASAPAQADQKA